jgi:SAM-dependent methyltransferase
MQATTLASAECCVEWQGPGTWHRDWRWFPRLDFRRDLMPGDLAERMQNADGGLVETEVSAQDAIPSAGEGALLSLNRGPVEAAFRQRHLHGPYRGRFYPRGVLAGVGGAGTLYRQDPHPFRVVDVDDRQVAVDLGHPLSGYSLKVGGRATACIKRKEERGGSCTDLVAALADGGPGMQCPPAGSGVDFARPDSFVRGDPTPDEVFYRQPRMVQHIDRRARSFINRVYRRFVRPGDRVVDLLSSWVSHLDGVEEATGITGLGMNAEELKANRRLHDYLVHDLNRDPHLPWPDASFDVAVCTASLEYLTKPYTVLAEVARVLAPGGRFVVTFSDRWFPPKVVRVWTLLHPFERMGLVLDYFRRTGAFTALGTESWSGWPRPEDDKYFPRLLHADPVFAVWGERV